jgi:hypothetical protein
MKELEQGSKAVRLAATSMLWPNPTMNYSQEQIGVGGTPGADR